MDDQSFKGAPEDLKPGEPTPTEKPYTEIIQSHVDPVDPTLLKENGAPAKIMFFCRDCEKPVEAKRIGNKLKFACALCKKTNVAYGSEKSIKSFYRIKEETPEPTPTP